MRIGRIEATAGTHVFGYLDVARSRSGLTRIFLFTCFVERSLVQRSWFKALSTAMKITSERSRS